MTEEFKEAEEACACSPVGERPACSTSPKDDLELDLRKGAGGFGAIAGRLKLSRLVLRSKSEVH